MKHVFFLTILLFSVTCFSQDLDCEDFNEGTFFGTSPQLPGLEWKVIRSNFQQSEEITKAPQEWIDNGLPLVPVYGKFELIGECTYKFIYDGSKMELDQNQIESNQSGGIIVKIERIENNCFYYSSSTIFNGTKSTIQGSLCKQKK